MKRLDPSHVPAALHTAKSASLLAVYLAGQSGSSAEAALLHAFAILGYQLTPAGIRAGKDPTVARALALTTAGMGVRS